MACHMWIKNTDKILKIYADDVGQAASRRDAFVLRRADQQRSW